MASSDLPAMINYVTAQTKVDQLYYVGFSMGTMTAFAEFSRNHELEKKVNVDSENRLKNYKWTPCILFEEEEDNISIQIKQYFALGPVASVAHIKGLMKWMADRYEMIDVTSKINEYFVEWKNGGFKIILLMTGEDEFLPPDKFTQWVAEG